MEAWGCAWTRTRCLREYLHISDVGAWTRTRCLREYLHISDVGILIQHMWVCALLTPVLRFLSFVPSLCVFHGCVCPCLTADCHSPAHLFTCPPHSRGAGYIRLKATWGNAILRFLVPGPCLLPIKGHSLWKLVCSPSCQTIWGTHERTLRPLDGFR